MPFQKSWSRVFPGVLAFLCCLVISQGFGTSCKRIYSLDQQPTASLEPVILADAPTSPPIAAPADAAQQHEHAALLDLVPIGDATHVAVQDGGWFDPKVWQSRQVPGDGARVLIPEDIAVIYSDISDTRLFTLRVDGQLAFAPDRDTKMVIDTLVVSPMGQLTIGSRQAPVQDDHIAQIVIADNGPIDKRWDPEQLSRGLISQGVTEIHGSEKVTHLKLAQDAQAGDRELVLTDIPSGWRVGDRLVLTGTHYLPDQWNGSAGVWQGTQDEVLTVKAIRDRTVLLEQPLAYDHDSPRDSLKAAVANYSRNVAIATEHAADLPADQRGHVMFMHSDRVDVRYAEFYELGRSDKSKPLDDYRLDADGHRLLDEAGKPIKNSPEDITNQRGRYAVHFHRAGVDDPDRPPAIAVGNAVWGSPGWGYVHHDSHLILDSNVAYSVFGAAFVTETGNEIGAWRHNIAIKSEGLRRISKAGADVINHDLARNGTGFWFQGRLVEDEGNIAAGQRHSGFTYMLRGNDQKDVLRDNLPDPAIARYRPTLSPAVPPIRGFRNNEAIASGKGLEVIKANARQGHDVRSVLAGFTAWEVEDGFEVQYTSKYTFKDFLLIGAAARAKTGADFAQNAEDMVINGATIEGFKVGINFEKESTAGDLDDWHFVLIDTKLTNNETDWQNFDSDVDRTMSRADLKPERLRLELDDQADFVFDPDSGDRQASITGIKHDSIGAIAFPSGLDTYRFDDKSLRSRLQQGYFVDSKGTRFITVEELVSDRASGELLELRFAVVLTDDWQDSTLGGLLGQAPKLGTYPGIVQPGPVSADLETWLEL